MILRAECDCFGNAEHFSSDKLRHILDLIDGYMKVPYELIEIRQENVNDPHGRIDIEIRFYKNNILRQQKLLILDDELIDGKAFHERFNEWY